MGLPVAILKDSLFLQKEVLDFDQIVCEVLTI